MRGVNLSRSAVRGKAGAKCAQSRQQWQWQKRCVCQAQAQRPEGGTVEDPRAKQIRLEVTQRIAKLGRSGKTKQAVSELAEMAKLGVQPDTVAATALINACTKNGKMEMAQGVFDELFGEFLRPDDIVFSILVRGYGELKPPRWTSISSLITMMDKKFQLRPTILVYNALLDICAKTNDEERGVEIINRMEASGIEPDWFTLEVVKNRKSLRSHLRRTFNNVNVY